MGPCHGGAVDEQVVHGDLPVALARDGEPRVRTDEVSGIHPSEHEFAPGFSRGGLVAVQPKGKDILGNQTLGKGVVKRRHHVVAAYKLKQIR